MVREGFSFASVRIKVHFKSSDTLLERIMSSYSIGEVARMCGLSPSAIRYYESAGLVPKPMRVSRQRRYTAQGIGRLRLVQLAREAGLTIAETRAFTGGFASAIPPAARWQMLAGRKLAQIEQELTRLDRMRRLLVSSFKCECSSLEECARVFAKERQDALRLPSNRRRTGREKV